jgi:hypothetical protein
MKKYIVIVLGFVVTLLITSACNEEIALTADFKETAVVYGLLDQADSVHYIKINRAFIGPGNSIEIAKIPDSSYFKSINGTVKEYVDGVLSRTWELQETEVENKSTSGVFYAPKQKLYYFVTSSSTPLKENASFKLDFDVNDGAFSVSAETKLVTGVTTPGILQTSAFRFASNPQIYTSSSLTVSNSGSSTILNSSVDITINEYIDAIKTQKTFRWNLGEVQTSPGSEETFTLNGQTFYDLVNQNVTKDPAITKRTIEAFNIVITAGAEEFSNYMLVNQPSSSLAQSKPAYTNLKATNNHAVIGIFSARSTTEIYRPYSISNQPYIRIIDKKSTYELCKGGITGALLFCSQHDGDKNESYYCN